jgi:hypothetical protein
MKIFLMYRIFSLNDYFLMLRESVDWDFDIYKLFWKKRENMRSIKRTRLSVVLFLCTLFCGHSVFAHDFPQMPIETPFKQETDSTNAYIKSPMTLVSTDFSFGLLDETEARLVGRGRKGLRARPISLRR